jgi:hypothetical protein
MELFARHAACSTCTYPIRDSVITLRSDLSEMALLMRLLRDEQLLPICRALFDGDSGTEPQGDGHERSFRMPFFWLVSYRRMFRHWHKGSVGRFANQRRRFGGNLNHIDMVCGEDFQLFSREMGRKILYPKLVPSSTIRKHEFEGPRQNCCFRLLLEWYDFSSGSIHALFFASIFVLF